MAIACRIEFENPVIYSGETLRGKIYLRLLRAQTISRIHLQIRGQARTHWTQGVDGNKKFYSGIENYLESEADFDVSGEVRSTADSYRYLFEGYVPVDLPSSFDSEFGYIRYRVCIALEIPGQQNEQFEKTLTVIKKVDLNDRINIATHEPRILTKKSHHCFLPFFCYCNPNPLEITLQTPVGGYVPNQTINFSINVNDKRISKFTVQLMKVVTYYQYANSSRRYVETSMISKTEMSGRRRNQEDLIHANVRVPPNTQPTDSTSSGIIKVRYYCRITGIVEGCHRNIDMDLPITIGSHPIFGESQENSTSTSQHQATSMQPGQIAPTLNRFRPSITSLSGRSNGSAISYLSLSNDTPNDDLPSYEEAIHLGKQKSDERF